MGNLKISLCATALIAGGVLTGCAGEPSAGPSTAPAASVSSTPAPTATSTPTATPTPTPTHTPTPALASVVLICGNLDKDVDYTPQEIPIASDGTPDFSGLWKQHFSCDTGMGDEGVTDTVPVQTPLQRGVVAFARSIGYGEFEGYTNDEQNLYSVAEGCGGNDPADYYATAKDLSDPQVDEVRLYLTLCPNHPQAKKWRAAISASAAARKAEKDGTRVYDGTYKVPSQMKRGTYVVKDVKDCYWETRNSSGNIVANNFVAAAARVVAVVGRSAVVFTAEGCGQWDRQ